MKYSNYIISHWILTACFLFENMSETKDIRLPALGRRAQFFEVYNLVEDELTRVIAIPRSNEKKYKVKTVPLYIRDYVNTVAATMTEFINSWNFGIAVKAATVLSCFKGLEAGFDMKKHWENSKLSIVQVISIKVKTIREEVDPCNKEIWRAPTQQPERNKEVFSASRIVGDHVLVAKEYGFEVDIYVKLTSKSSEVGMDIGANLEMSMEKIMSKISFEIDVDAKGSGGNADITKEVDVTVSVNTRYATFPFSAPTDYRDVPNFVKNITAYLNDQKNLNGSVVEFIMKPAHEIEKCTKIGSVAPKNYTDLDRISERMITFFLEIDRQETENYRFQSRFDYARDCLNATEYAIVVREIMDTRMVLMDLRIQVIESIDTYRRGKDSYRSIITVLSTLTRETSGKKFSVTKFIPEDLIHKINFIFAMANDHGIYCFPRYMNPTLHYDSYIQDRVTLAFIVFRSADFNSGILGLEQYIKMMKIVQYQQSPLSEREILNEQMNFGPGCINYGFGEPCTNNWQMLRINEITGNVDKYATHLRYDRKMFIALNCDNDFDVCGILPDAGLYHGWTYEKVDQYRATDFFLMSTDLYRGNRKTRKPKRHQDKLVKNDTVDVEGVSYSTIKISSR